MMSDGSKQKVETSPIAVGIDRFLESRISELLLIVLALDSVWVLAKHI
jgi:hypothetical protein